MGGFTTARQIGLGNSLGFGWRCFIRLGIDQNHFQASVAHQAVYILRRTQSHSQHYRMNHQRNTHGQGQKSFSMEKGNKHLLSSKNG
jgi:hypothetical protein